MPESTMPLRAASWWCDTGLDATGHLAVKTERRMLRQCGVRRL